MDARVLYPESRQNRPSAALCTRGFDARSSSLSSLYCVRVLCVLIASIDPVLGFYCSRAPFVGTPCVKRVR